MSTRREKKVNIFILISLLSQCILTGFPRRVIPSSILSLIRALPHPMLPLCRIQDDPRELCAAFVWSLSDCLRSFGQIRLLNKLHCVVSTLHEKKKKMICTYSLLACKTWVHCISWFVSTILYDAIILSMTNVAFHFRSLYTAFKGYNAVNIVLFVLSW